MEYIFKTSCSMKLYNCKKWWISSDMIPEIRIKAESIPAALRMYAEKADAYGATVTRNGIKNRQPMYRDSKDGEPKQIGFVITGKSLFRDDDKYKWTEQYIDLWIEILTVNYPAEFEIPAA